MPTDLASFPTAENTFQLTATDKKSICRISEYNAIDDKRYVVATELAENKGLPLSKGAEGFIAAYIEQIPPMDRAKQFLWIEHWAPNSYKTHGSFEETFEWVEFTQQGSAVRVTSRKRLAAASIAARIAVRDNLLRPDRRFR